MIERASPGQWHFIILALSYTGSMIVALWSIKTTLLRDVERVTRAADDVREMRAELDSLRAERHRLKEGLADTYGALGSCTHVGPDGGMCLTCVVSACERIERTITMAGGRAMRERWAQKRS